MNDLRRDFPPTKTGSFIAKDAIACREEEIERRGKFVTFEIGDESIIIACDDGNRIATFFNVVTIPRNVSSMYSRWSDMLRTSSDHATGVSPALAGCEFPAKLQQGRFDEFHPWSSEAMRVLY